MQQERDDKRNCCSNVITRTVMSFLDCLNLRHSSSSFTSKKEVKEEEDSSVEITMRGLNLAGKRGRKQPVSSGKRGGVNNYDM